MKKILKGMVKVTTIISTIIGFIGLLGAGLFTFEVKFSKDDYWKKSWNIAKEGVKKVEEL